MALQPARAPSADARRSFPLAALPQPRAAPSTAGALVAPRRLQAPGSRAATWPQQQGSGTPARKVAVHWRRRWRSRLRSALIVVGLRRAHRWCRCTAVRLVYSRTALAPVSVPVAGLALHGNVLHRASIAVPLLGLPLHRHALRQVVDRRARHPRQVLGVEGPAPRRAGVLPPQVRRAEPAAGRWRHDGAEPALTRSCSTQGPRRRCTPV
jgi:hypothetical protein